MKYLKRLILRERTPQIIFALGALPCLVFWALGQKISTLVAIVCGFNIGCALYYEFYLSMRRSRDAWAKMAQVPEKAEFEEMLAVAKGLVKARLKASHIDPAKN